MITDWHSYWRSEVSAVTRLIQVFLLHRRVSAGWSPTGNQQTWWPISKHCEWETLTHTLAHTHPLTLSHTHLSMGVMMKGMVERPMAVVVHLRTGSGQRVVFPSRKRDAAQTRLMVNPGIATEARACHTKVSTTATPTRTAFPASSPWAFRQDEAYVFVQLKERNKDEWILIWDSPPLLSCLYPGRPQTRMQ